ncbi:hypothetical protein HXX76_006729 [Chlamydomonas incerta]|nr:hypothetical protein HXX76_006729 [Chlamydomonas incerta]|eukprot:KAG2436425.1 hypothetical protein HXX76_006729 [Chlamydomonas incerta]
MKTSAAPEEPDEQCVRGSFAFAKGRCALTLGAYAPQVTILLDGGANVTVAQNDVGVSRLPGSDVVWARGGQKNQGTGGSGGGELKPCDATLCPYSALADVLPAPEEGNGSSSSGIGAWHAQASLAGGPGKQPRLVNYSPQSPASLLMGAVNKRSDVLAQLLGYQLLLYLASPSRFLETVAGSKAALVPAVAPGAPAAAAAAAQGSNSNSTAAVSPLHVVEPVRPALLSASTSSGVWRAAGHEQELVARALPVLAEANQHPNHAWGLRMANGAYYLELVENIIEGIEQGLVVPDDIAAATLDELEDRANSSKAWPAAAAAAGGVEHRRRGRALAQKVTEFTDAVKPVELQAALSRAAALAAAFYSPAVYRSNYLASLVTHSLDHTHDMDSAVASQSSGGSTSTAVLVGAVLGSVGGVALLLSIMVGLVVFGSRGGGLHAAMHRRLPWLMMALGLRRRRFKPHNYDISAHAQVKAPGISSRSALLVTDIEDSTRLWEEIAADVMSRALQLHHACIRHLVVEHHGYESATEGDSFILAFQTVKHAVAFATELQSQLLVLPWPQELLMDKTCMPVYTDLPEGFPFTHHEPEDIEAASPRVGAGADAARGAYAGEGAGSPFASAPGVAQSALASQGRRLRRGGSNAAAVDVMDLTCSTARMDGFTQNGYSNSGPPTPTATSMSAAAQMIGRPQPSLAALEHICSIRRSQEGGRRSSVAGGGRSKSAVLPGRLHCLRSSGTSATARESGGSSGSAGTGTPRSKAASILASAAATARAAASAAADRMRWRGDTRGNSTSSLPRLRTPLGRGSLPSGAERSVASRAAIAAPPPASGDLQDGEEAGGVEEAGAAPFWGTHERSTTACVLQRERDSSMQPWRPPQLLIPMSVGGEEEFSSCSWFSSSGRGNGSDEGGSGGGGGTVSGESYGRSDLPDGATVSALTSGNYEILSEPMSPERFHDTAHAVHAHAPRGGHGGERARALLGPGADGHDHLHHHQHHRRRHRRSRHSNGSHEDYDHHHVHEPRDRNSVTAALPPVLPWLPSGNQGYADDDAAMTEVTADDLIGVGANVAAGALAAGTASFALAATADEDESELFRHSDENEDLLSVTAALSTNHHGRSSLPYAADASAPAEYSDGGSVQLYPQLLHMTGSLAMASRPSRSRMSPTGMGGAAAGATTSGPAGVWNRPGAVHSGGGAGGQRPPTLLLPQAPDLEDSTGGDACGSRESRAAEQGQRSTAGECASPSMGAMLRTAAGIATPLSAKGMSRRLTAAGVGYEQVSDFATASSAAGTPEVAAATAAMEVLEAAMPPPLWTLPAQGRTLGQLLSELPPASCFTGATAAGRTRRALMFRGLRVRVGIHTGVNSAAEMQYNAASARIVYGGPCVATCKAIADFANGGQIFLSAAAKEQLDEAVHHHNGGKPPGILVLRLGAYAKEAASVPPPTTNAGLLGQCTPRRMLSRLPPSSNNITALAGGGYAVGGIGGNSMLLHRAQTSAGSAAAAMLDDYSASAAVSRQTTRADGGCGVAAGRPASAVRHSSGLPSAATGGLTLMQQLAASAPVASTAAAAGRGPSTIPMNLMLPASTSEIEAPQRQQQQQPRGDMSKARSLLQLQQEAEPTSSGSRRRALAGDPGVAAGQSTSPPKETAVFWLTSSSLSQRIALVSRPRVPKDHSPLQDVYDAPVGRLSYVVLQVPAAAALMAWDAEIAGGALRLLQDTARSAMRKYTCGAYLSCSQPGELTAAFGSSAAAVRWAEGLRKELLHAPWSEALLAHELCEVVEVPESDSSCSDFFIEEEGSTMGDTDLDAPPHGPTPPRGFAQGRSRSGATSAASASDMQRRVSISSASVGFAGNLSNRQMQRAPREVADRGFSSSRGRGATTQGIRGEATVASITAAGGLAAWISSRLDKAAGLGAGASAPASPLALGSAPRRRHVTAAGLSIAPAASAAAATASPPSTPRASTAETASTASAVVAAATLVSSTASGAITGGGGPATALPPAAQELSTSATLMGPFTHVPSRLGLMHRPPMTPQALSPLPAPPTAAVAVATPAASITGDSTPMSTTGLLPPQNGHLLSRANAAAPSSQVSNPPCSDYSPRTSMGAWPCSGGSQLRAGASSAPDAAAGVDPATEAGTLAEPMEPEDDGAAPSVPTEVSASMYLPEKRLHEASAHGHPAASDTTAVHDLLASPRCSAQLVAPLEPAGGGSRGTTSMAAAVAEYMEARWSQARAGDGDGTGAAVAGQGSSMCGRNSLSSALDGLQAGELHAASLEPMSTDDPATAAGSTVSGAGTGQRGGQQPQSPLSPITPRSPKDSPLVQHQPQSQRQHNAPPPAPHLHNLRLGSSTSLEAELRQGGVAGAWSMPGAHQVTACCNGMNAHHGKGADVLESIAEPMPDSAFDAAATADAASVTVPGLSLVPQGPVERNQLASLEELLPQCLEPRGLPREWQSEQQNVILEDQAGTRCDSTLVGADGGAPHLLLRGLRIRVGIATGRPTWSAADHTHELAYSGKPVRLAQRLAGAVAACGQVVCCAVTCQEALATQQHELLQQQQLAAAIAQRGSNGNGNGNRTSVGRSLSAQPSSIAEEAHERGVAAGAAGAAADGAAAPAAAAAAAAASAADSAPMLMAFMPVMEGSAPAYLGGRTRDKKKRWKQVVFVVSLFPPDAPPPSLAAVAAVNRPRLPSAALTPAAVRAGDRYAGWLMAVNRSPATPAATPRGAGGVSASLLSFTPGSARSHASMPLLKLAGAARSGMAAVAAVAAAAGLKQPSRAAMAMTPPRTRLTSAAGSFVGRINTGNDMQAGGGYGGSMPLLKLMPMAQANLQASKDRSPEQGAAAGGAEAEQAPEMDGILIGGARGDGDAEGDGDGYEGPAYSSRSDQQPCGAARSRQSLPAATFAPSFAGAPHLPPRSTSSNAGGGRPPAFAGWLRPAQAAAAAAAMPQAPVSQGGSPGECRRTDPLVSLHSSDTGRWSAASPLSDIGFGSLAGGAARPNREPAAGFQGSLPPSLAPGLHGAPKPWSRLRQPATYSGDGSSRDVSNASAVHHSRGSVTVAGVMLAASRSGTGMGASRTSIDVTAESWRVEAPVADGYPGLQQHRRPLELPAADPHPAVLGRGAALSASALGVGGFAGHSLRAAPLLGLQADAVTEERSADLSGALKTTASGLLGGASSPGAPLAVGPLEMTAAEGEHEVVSMLITRSAKSVQASAACD